MPRQDPPTESDMFTLAHPTLNDHNLRRLRHQTFHLLNDSTLLFSLRNHNSDALLALTHRLVQTNNFHIEPLTNKIDNFYISRIFCSSIGRNPTAKYKYPLIKWSGSHFFISNETITFGNCPRCFTAYPIGIRCAHCFNSYATTLFFLKDPIDYIQLVNNRRRNYFYGPPPQFKNKLPASPFQLSHILLHQPCTFYFDYTTLDNTSTATGYRPQDSDLFDIIPLHYLLTYIRNHKLNLVTHFGVAIEQLVSQATNTDYNDVHNCFQKTQFWDYVNAPQFPHKSEPHI